MWSLTISPAVATTIAHQQAHDAVRSARRARQARLSVEGREPQAWTRPARRHTRPRWTRVLAHRAAH